jgi:hypothetical protein
MKISDIHSVELDRTKPFNHVIRIKDKHGHSLQVVPVKENVENEQLKLITNAWLNHPDANPEPPTAEELYERRK